ncbi:uncharacterized protein LOC129717684 isoform X2 [Wyeomyia smithii]|uniref:uncharacterized protein LOC129717684 isoform X2 n=1 Tax=Wyeomyia smithii TaxID=174621 RepID=UPI002467E585|nr:uncharacterized protein LOC129717684 isoform X2 [Wyeomyia smithii]XP_055523750.1 uncharacterized protein LOC129717684 isoform X2 [Wyeomyia smithii]XP_055523751.1 uncharacterized protein LOC129717684 isoform X2 [Wyeomyia smithii]
MKSCRWSTTMLLLALCIGAALAAPSVRVKRQEDKDAEASATGTNPVGAEDASISDDLDRDKRKAPSDPKFEAKNAILGFVFGKINSIIDAKTRLIDKLDHANIEKNKQYHIESPKPIGDLSQLISSVITPKVQFITQKFGSLSSGLLGGFSGGSNGDGHSDEHGNGNAPPALGGVVSSLLKLSGPILSGSSGGNGGSNSVSLNDHDDDDDE